jgi:hypothetical protein
MSAMIARACASALSSEAIATTKKTAARDSGASTLCGSIGARSRLVFAMSVDALFYATALRRESKSATATISKRVLDTGRQSLQRITSITNGSSQRLRKSQTRPVGWMRQVAPW